MYLSNYPLLNEYIKVLQTYSSKYFKNPDLFNDQNFHIDPENTIGLLEDNYYCNDVVVEYHVRVMVDITKFCLYELCYTKGGLYVNIFERDNENGAYTSLGDAQKLSPNILKTLHQVFVKLNRYAKELK